MGRPAQAPPAPRPELTSAGRGFLAGAEASLHRARSARRRAPQLLSISPSTGCNSARAANDVLRSPTTLNTGEEGGDHVTRRAATHVPDR